MKNLFVRIAGLPPPAAAAVSKAAILNIPGGTSRDWIKIIATAGAVPALFAALFKIIFHLKIIRTEYEKAVPPGCSTAIGSVLPEGRGP
jgi:hypothetical protein